MAAKDFIHVDGRKICPLDQCCLNENSKHFEDFAHPQRSQFFLISPTYTRKGGIALCKHDEYCSVSKCTLQHPRREARKKTSDTRPFCSFDEFCTNQTPSHRVQYRHPRFDVKNMERIEEEGGVEEEPKKKATPPPPQTYSTPVGVMPQVYMPAAQGYMMTPQGYMMPVVQGYPGYMANSQGYMAGGGYMANASGYLSPSSNGSPPPGFGMMGYGSPSYTYQSFGTTSAPSPPLQQTTTLPKLPPLPPKKIPSPTSTITGGESALKAKRQFELEEEKGQARCFNDMCCYCARPANTTTVGEHQRLDCSKCRVSFMIDPKEARWKEVEYETTTPP